MKINRQRAVAVALPQSGGTHVHAVIPSRRVKLFAGTAHQALAEARRQASIPIKSSIRWSLAG